MEKRSDTAPSEWPSMSGSGYTHGATPDDESKPVSVETRPAVSVRTLIDNGWGPFGVPLDDP